MSCDAVAAVFLYFAAASPQAAQPLLVRAADTSAAATVNFRAEPLFVDIVLRAKSLKDTVAVMRSALGQGEQASAYDRFKAEITTLSELDFKAHQSLEERGLDGDLKCILRGISADLTLKLADLDTAKDVKAKDKALKEMTYLLNDNVEVITAPPAPPV